MTADTFRKMALKCPQAVESVHMNHPDFRINGKIFATLGHPDEKWGMVKLTPEQQRTLVGKEPEVFKPCSGAWGLRGATNVQLAPAKEGAVRAALDWAFQNVAAATKGKKG